MDRKEVGMLLKVKRKQLKLTQMETAKRAGIKYQAYQKFETGERDIRNASFSIACKVLLALNLAPLKFYLGEYHLSEIEKNISYNKHRKKFKGKAGNKNTALSQHYIAETDH